MGYNIFFQNSEGTYSGTKHYGYGFTFAGEENALKYPSVRYLLYLKKITKRTIFRDGSYPNFTLTNRQFRHFIKLYFNEIDYKEELENIRIRELVESKQEILVGWW